MSRYIDMYERIEQQHRGGFIALTATIMISLSLLTIVTALSFHGFVNRFSILESELKLKSTYAAEACVEVAMLRIAQADHYHLTTFPISVRIDAANCEIIAVTPGTFPGEFTIEARAVSGGAVTNLQVEVYVSDAPDVEVISWREVPTL